MSGLALGWARKRRDAPSREAKALMMFLADNANEQMAWPSKRTLALDMMCSEKTVMRLLGEIVEAGLLIRLDVEDKATGRTRTCGYYFPIHGRPPTAEEVAAFEREVGGRVTRVSPWEGDTGVPLEGDMGVRGRGTTVSPLYEPPLEPSGPEGPSPGAGEREALVEKIESAMPARLLAVSSRPAYLDALELLAEQGVDLDQLPDCVARWVASPLFAGRKVPVALERWLLNGMWRGSLPEPELALAVVAAPAEPRLDEAPGEDLQLWGRVEARLRSALVEADLAAFARSYLGARSGLLFVVAWSGWSRDRIRDRMWKRVAAWWSEIDPTRRPLTLISKAEFEAGAARQSGGV